jgi:hypothetical protein
VTDHPPWVRKLLSYCDSRLDPGLIRFVCVTVLLLSLVLLVVSFVTAEPNGKTLFGPPLGADYAGFYTAGTILNRHESTSLYNRAEQDRIHHEVHPFLRLEETAPYVHPPFVALAFRPLARLPYAWSFAVWLFISLALYLAGLVLTLRTLPALSAADRLTALLLALSFEPFVMECWLGGQLSAVGFFCLAAAVALDRSDRPFASGLVLGLCLYKPTLLVLVLPMLLAARRFWTLLGVALTAAALGLLCLGAVGWEGSRAYLDVLLGFTRTTTQSGALELRTWKYVDLNAFTRLLLHGPSLGQRLLLLALALPPFLALLRAAWKLDQRDEVSRQLLWSATLLGTPVLNLYVGIYDSILAVLGALLLAGVLRQRAPALPPGLRAWLVALYVVPWFTQPLARSPLGLQPLTLVLFGLTIYSLWLIRRQIALPLY